MTAKTTVSDVPDMRRFEIKVDGRLAGFAAYKLAPNLVVFTHTEIDQAFEGKGFGSALARGALDAVRERGLAVQPLCPFFKGWIRRHPDYADLVHRAPRSEASD